MNYVLFFISLALISQSVTGYLIVQDDDSSSESEGERELSLKQRMDNLEASLAKMQETVDHRNNCSVSPASVYACPDCWLPYSGSCYYFGLENLIFERAKWVFPSGLVTDKDTAGVWRWYNNNSTAIYLGWVKGEPNDNLSAEDCAVLSWYQSEGWVDLPCTAHAHRALCEKHIST